MSLYSGERESGFRGMGVRRAGSGRSRSAAILVGVALPVCLALPACGGDSEDGVEADAAAPEVTRAAFVKRADAICEAEERKFYASYNKLRRRAGLKPVKVGGGSPATLDVAAKATRRRAAQARTAARKVGRLAAPAADAPLVERYVALTREVAESNADLAELYRRAFEAAEAGDGAANKRLLDRAAVRTEHIGKIAERRAKAMRPFRFEHCAQVVDG